LPWYPWKEPKNGACLLPKKFLRELQNNSPLVVDRHTSRELDGMLRSEPRAPGHYRSRWPVRNRRKTQSPGNGDRNQALHHDANEPAARPCTPDITDEQFWQTLGVLTLQSEIRALAEILRRPERALNVYQQSPAHEPMRAFASHVAPEPNAPLPKLSGYPTVDLQIRRIMAESKAALPDLLPTYLEDFERCLVFLADYGGMVMQSGAFRNKTVDEKRDFQQHLLQHMRVALGEDVREEETVGGGRLDLRFKNIPIELKVEYAIQDRQKLLKKYTQQPAQYAASSIPLAITCILDMTEKTHPPANIANNLTLETPIVHGFEDSPPSYPTKVAVVIINGNLKTPSEYSKRRAKTTEKSRANLARKPKPSTGKRRSS
jgi:hypothetical protein